MGGAVFVVRVECDRGVCGFEFCGGVLDIVQDDVERGRGDVEEDVVRAVLRAAGVADPRVFAVGICLCVNFPGAGVDNVS